MDSKSCTTDDDDFVDAPNVLFTKNDDAKSNGVFIASSLCGASMNTGNATSSLCGASFGDVLFSMQEDVATDSMEELNRLIKRLAGQPTRSPGAQPRAKTQD